MSRVTLAVFLTVECATEGAAEGVVDDLLDAGFFQDAINDDLPDGRVTCAVVRSVTPEVLTAHNAHREDEICDHCGDAMPCEEHAPCPVCGCEIRGQGGYLQCECPAPLKSDVTDTPLGPAPRLCAGCSAAENLPHAGPFVERAGEMVCRSCAFHADEQVAK